jgi:tRNA pseudouridine55 synthase
MTGLVIVDKPAGWTSHDAVARIRRLAHTRRVGHAGTLDPMATGVLVVAVGAATRLLAHLVLTDKAYTGTIRLGQTTSTDDAMGELTSDESTGHVSEEAVRGAMRQFTGEIRQVPSSVSAVKVAGRRAYQRVRAGEAVQLEPRLVTVTRFEPVKFARAGEHLDVEVDVACSSGTYVRALARDLGVLLGVGGHLTSLRRTRVGPFTLADARTLDELAALDQPVTLSLADAVRRAMPVRDVTATQAGELSYGRPIGAVGMSGTYAALAGETVVALLREHGELAKPVAVFAPAVGTPGHLTVRLVQPCREPPASEGLTL